MTTDDRRLLGDDEYQFPHDEYEAKPAAEGDADLQFTEENLDQTSPPEKAMSALQNFSFAKYKKAIIVLVLIALAFILFKIMSPTKKPAQVAEKPAVMQPVQQAQPKPKPVMEIPAPAPEPAPRMELSSEYNNLKQSTEVTQNAVQQLQSQVQDLKQSLSQASDNQAQLTQTVSNLADQVKALTDKLTELNAPKKAAEPPPIVYYLKAVVPGRAWIESTTGEADNVTVGDEIEQYGTVQEIDDQKGIVLTSSGKVIKYGNKDS